MPGSRQASATSLSTSERLLLAQAVYELGSDAWPNVAKLVVNHPVVSKRKSFFTSQSCNEIYLNLMTQAGLDCSEAHNTRPRAPLHLKLAQLHYQARVQELRELILAEETKFKTVLAEIEEIRAGLWDDKIKAGLGLTPPIDRTTVPSPSPKEPLVQPPETTFTYDVSTTETKRNPELDLPSTSTSPPSSAPIANKTTPMDQSREAEAPDYESQSTTGQEKTITETEDIGQTQYSEEDEVLQLMHSQLSPGPSDNITVEKNLVPMYLDESSSPLEHTQPSPKSSTADADSESLQTDPTEKFEHEPQENHNELSEVQEDSASRAGSEQPLSATTHEVQADSESFVDVSQDIGLLQHEPPEDLTTEVLQEPTLSEHFVESPKQLDVEAGTQTRRGKRKADFDAEVKREKKKAREESEPIEEEEPAPTSRRRRNHSQSADHVAARRFQNLIGLVHSQISQHRNGNIFHNPIKLSEAPDYHDIVKRPMDLKTIKARIKDGVISTSLEYQRDVYLMFVNSMMYNRPNSDIYNMAEEMMLESELHIRNFRQTEGWTNR